MTLTSATIHLKKSAGVIYAQRVSALHGRPTEFILHEQPVGPGVIVLVSAQHTFSLLATMLRRLPTAPLLVHVAMPIFPARRLQHQKSGHRQ